jgi:signal transduction histidine kinase
MLIAIAFSLNWMVASETIRGEKVADLEKVLKHVLMESTDEYIHSPLTPKSDLTFLYSIPHTEMVLKESEASHLQFVITKTPHFPQQTQIAVAHLLSNGYYLNAISDSEKVNVSVHKYAQKLLIRYLFSLLVILLISIFLLDYYMKPLSVLAQKTREWNSKEPFDFSLDNPGTEIAEVSKGFSTLIHRLEVFRSKEAELFKEAAHELKTPLALMRSRLDVYQNNAKYEKHKFTEDLGDDLQRLTAELKNVLFLEGSDFEEESIVDVIQTVKKLETKMGILIQRKQLMLKLPLESFSIVTCEKLLSKVLSALLENAITYAKENTIVEIGSDPTMKKIWIRNTVGAEKYLFSSKIGEKILKRLSREIGFEYTITQDEAYFRIELVF